MAQLPMYQGIGSGATAEDAFRGQLRHLMEHFDVTRTTDPPGPITTTSRPECPACNAWSPGNT